MTSLNGYNRRRLQLGSPPSAAPSSFIEKKGLDCLIVATEFSAVFLGLIQLWPRDAYSRTAASNTNDQVTPVIGIGASVIVGAEACRGRRLRAKGRLERWLPRLQASD
uniref:Uncharacterized protein n=1 Tax=Oryza meridionalis TaxID=40149 RepID=A0A0E0E1K8_9ORYZ